MANFRPDEQKSHMRQFHPGGEGKLLQGPIVIREGGAVYVTGRWKEGRANYPGRSVNLLRATGIAIKTSFIYFREHSYWSARWIIYVNLKRY
jgi:hypothetical protein